MEESYARQYALLEGEHWWFRARRAVLRDLLAHLGWPHQPRILEIGVGPGHNLLEIYPLDAQLEGVEPDDALARLAAARGPVPIFQASIDRLPSEIRDGSYDGVAMFDVLEHIEDDARALQIVNRKLKPGGRAVLSVPAYMWLWGQQDAVNQHFRRYTLRELREKLQAADFTIERMTYFNTLLFPPIAAIRLIARYSRRPHRQEGDFAYARKASNSILLTLFATERVLLRYLDFPFGVSVFAAARKD
jgi:SAM-dependent methyltransferase